MQTPNEQTMLLSEGLHFGKTKLTSIDENRDRDSTIRASTPTPSNMRRSTTYRVLNIMVPKNFWKAVFAALYNKLFGLVSVFASSIIFKEYRFPPMSAQVIMAISQIIISSCLGKTSTYCTKRHFWPKFSINWRLGISLLPLSICYALRIYFSNVALGSVEVSTYQVFRQGSVLFSVILSFIILGSRPTFGIIVSCFVLFTGCAIASLDRSTVTVSGAIYGMVSSMCTALYIVVVKYFLPKVDNVPEVLINYNNFLGLIYLVPLMFLSNDYKELSNFLPWNPNHNDNLKHVWMIFSVWLISGFLVSISSIILVNEISPMSFEVIGMSKTAITSIIGMLLGDKISVGNVLGNIFALMGTGIYGKARHMAHIKQVKQIAEHKRNASITKRAFGYKRLTG